MLHYTCVDKIKENSCLLLYSFKSAAIAESRFNWNLKHWDLKSFCYEFVNCFQRLSDGFLAENFSRKAEMKSTVKVVVEQFLKTLENNSKRTL